MEDIHKLKEYNILKIHTSLIQATRGSEGIRNEGRLDLALKIPFQTFGGKELYPRFQGGFI